MNNSENIINKLAYKLYMNKLSNYDDPIYKYEYFIKYEINFFIQFKKLALQQIREKKLLKIVNE